MLWANWTDGLSVVTVVVVPVHIAGIEVHVPRVVRIVRIERTVVAVARSGERKRLGAGRRFCVSGTILFEAKGMLYASQLPHLYAIPAK